MTMYGSATVHRSVPTSDNAMYGAELTELLAVIWPETILATVLIAVRVWAYLAYGRALRKNERESTLALLGAGFSWVSMIVIVFVRARIFN